MGEFLSAREDLEKAIGLYDPERHRPLDFPGWADAGAAARSAAALTLYQLGYPDQALKRGKEGLALAQALSHPVSVFFARLFFGVLRQLRREPLAAVENAANAISVSVEYGLTGPMAYATTLHGWAMAEQGHHELGIAQIREGITMSRATGAGLWQQYQLCLLAEACGEAGRFADGLGALTQALTAAADEQEERHYHAEIHRLKGELLLKQNEDSNVAEAERCFQQAIEIAREQSAKSWELRATTSLARLLNEQGRRDEARAMLAEIYGWFTEGFDTADLKDAKALLNELGN
jgi:adenylate cyclase